MLWTVAFHPEFEREYDALSPTVQDAILSNARMLEALGPALKRPRSDTLSGSRHANMKELRFAADDGVWRVAYAFDPERRAILLIAGDKSGVAQKRFYTALIARADTRFDAHLQALKAKG